MTHYKDSFTNTNVLSCQTLATGHFFFSARINWLWLSVTHGWLDCSMASLFINRTSIDVVDSNNDNDVVDNDVIESDVIDNDVVDSDTFFLPLTSLLF